MREICTSGSEGGAGQANVRSLPLSSTASENEQVTPPCTVSLSVYDFGMILSAVITESEEGGFVALNPETGTTTQGETLDEAMENLQEATAPYLEEFPMTMRKPSVMTSFEVAHA